MLRSLFLLGVLACMLVVSAVGTAVADESEVATTASSVNWGIGLGLPYGGGGLNFESGERTRFAAGVGTLAEYGLGWNVGLKHYFKERGTSGGSGSLSLYFGTNSLHEQRYETYYYGTLISSHSDYETETGLSVGLGWTKGHLDFGALHGLGGDGSSVYVGYRF